MNVDPIQGAGRKGNTQLLLAGLTVVLGIALLAYMILVEDEPGAVPLGLIVAGTAWFFVARARARSRRP